MSITIRASKLGMTEIEAIRQRFGDVNLVIQIQPVDTADTLSSDECWALIDLLDWDADTNEHIVQPLLSALTALSEQQLCQFADWLAEQLWKLDTPQHAAVLQGEKSYLSVDDFLYVRCAVVANGRAFYEEVLAHPEAFPVEVTFEPLLYIAQEAYEQKTGRDMEHIPIYDFETYGNQQAWAR